MSSVSALVLSCSKRIYLELSASRRLPSRLLALLSLFGISFQCSSPMIRQPMFTCLHSVGQGFACSVATSAVPQRVL